MKSGAGGGGGAGTSSQLDLEGESRALSRLLCGFIPPGADAPPPSLLC